MADRLTPEEQADDLLIQLALTVNGEPGREERRARARAALRAQYVAGLGAALARVVDAFGTTACIADEIRELAEQAKDGK